MAEERSLAEERSSAQRNILVFVAVFRERAELKKTNLAYMQQHLAADLVAKALEFLQDPTHGAKRAAAARSLADDYKKME